MNLDYELLCKYIGKLWIETQLKIDKLIAENDKLRLEKDQALALLSNAPGREGINNFRICSGILRLKVNNHIILVKSPEAEHRYKANEIYRETLLDCLESGLYSESELLDFMMEKGYWSQQDDAQLEEVKKNIDDFKVGLFHAMTRSNRRRTIKKAIETANKVVEDLIKRRYAYNNLSAAATASMSKTKYLLASCSFFEDESPVINIKNYWSCNNDLIDMIIHKYNEEQLDDSDFRELSRYDGWRLIWACKKSTPNIFPQKNAVDLTMEQKRLIYWTSVYDGAYESMDCPPDDVFEDDDAFDGWLIIQNRKRKQDRQKATIEDSISEKLAGCDEVFIPAETPEDAKRIFEMNDEVSRSTQKIRERVISEKGVVNELDLPDVRRKLIMAVNQKSIKQLLELKMSDDIRKNIENYANYKANLRKEVNKKREIHQRSKEKLQQVLKKKMLTIAIGIIDKFESFFGNEWGHGLDESNISKEQDTKLDKWHQCRDEILNHANKIIRGLGNDLDSYNLEYRNGRD